MKKELSNLTSGNLGKMGWESIEHFDNISVISYQRLSSFIENTSEEELQSYYYAVFDECHYFYSDALFNPSTGETLRSIPVSFRNSFRIYMTATPECIIRPILIRPIYSAELSAIMNNEREGIKELLKKESEENNHNTEDSPSTCASIKSLFNEIKTEMPKCIIRPTGKTFRNLNLLPSIKIYHFPRDFSRYHRISFFSPLSNTINKATGNIDKDILLDEIKAIREKKMSTGSTFSSDRWIVFVSNKDYGLALKKELESIGITAHYFDSSSSKSEDEEERVRWAYLLEHGTTKSADFLITTSVLDNGFSIEDKSFKNIVLFTEDKTEFLQ